MAFFGWCYYWTLIVDFDSKKSTVGNYFLFRPLQFFIKHRGIIHSLFFGFFVMVLIAIFYTWLAFGFIVGFLGHLLMDSFTKRRVTPFWPLSKMKVGLGLVKSGGIIEMVIFVVFLFIDIALFLYLFLYS